MHHIIELGLCKFIYPGRPRLLHHGSLIKQEYCGRQFISNEWLILDTVNFATVPGIQEKMDKTLKELETTENLVVRKWK
jgi:hypothetical protein